ncbi:MAG: hypothetical protein HYZ34_00960 [Ignavibacteriae bacterium]|nr:hypothetical protein [Ignavibacteriota bacterium]
MNASKRCIIFIVLSFGIFSQFMFAQPAKQKTNAPEPNTTSASWKKSFRQGFSMKMWMSNDLVLGNPNYQGTGQPPISIPCGETLGLEYPIGNCSEHLYGAGPVIGGKIDGVRFVSESYNASLGYGYFRPHQADTVRNRIWITSATDSSKIEKGYYKKQMNKRGIDDDKDGSIDEDILDGVDNDKDWNPLSDDVGSDGLEDQFEIGCRGSYDPSSNPDPAFDNYDPTGNKRDTCLIFPRRMLNKDLYTQGNNIPDHGEPHVDEDFAAISDQDVYIYATDTSAGKYYTNHDSMGVKVIQKSYAWKHEMYDGILPIEYEFVNISNKTIRDVYLGFIVDADVGSQERYFYSNFVGYLDSLKTIYVTNPTEPNSTPFGLTLLETPKRFDSLNFSIRWFEFDTPCGALTDYEQYSCLDCSAWDGINCISPMPSQYNQLDVQFLFSFGPFANLIPGDTLRMTVAFLSGMGITIGKNNLAEHAIEARNLWGRGWRNPVIPPSPCLEASSVKEGIKLRWDIVKPGCVNPTETWDDSSRLSAIYGTDHWRRSNPPPGHTLGGRIFEGFRLYRADERNGEELQYTFLKQFDVADDPFGYNVGLQWEFTDSLVRKGMTYWYAVTSYSIPDISHVERKNPPGFGSILDTLYGRSYESSISENATKVFHSFGPSKKLGEVMVVPNPYRGDVYYVDDGGYEGPEVTWTPYKRMVRFIHLPSKAYIKIYSLTGDVITSIQHDDAHGNIAGQHDFNLFSESGRPLANGIYVFTVESEYGKQIGKFVIAR